MLCSMGGEMPSMRVTGWSNGSLVSLASGMACGSLAMTASTISLLAGMR